MNPQAKVKTFQEDVKIQSKRWVILVILNLFTFMSTLDASIVNIALPDISRHLDLPIAKTEWVVSSYLIAICTLILFFGKLGDIIGKIKIYRIGMIIFIIGSLLCGLSSSLWSLVLFRVIQALGSSMTMANSQGIVTEIFPAKERGRALGLIGTFVSLGSIAGPSLGGLLISGLGWPSIFWVNVPIGLIAMIIGWRMLPKDITFVKEKLDVSGTSLFIIFILCLFSGLLLGQQTGFENPWIITAFIIAVVALACFLWEESHKPNPMLHLTLFKNPLFSLSIFCGFLVFVANFCFNIISPFYTQDILQLSPSSAGFLLMLFPITMAVVAPFSGALSDKIGSELLTFIGLLVMVITQIGLASLHEGSSIIMVGLYIALLGLGSGLFQSPNNSLIMSTVPRFQLGIAGSVNALIRNLGMVVGISVATTTLFSVMSVKAGYRVTGLISGRPDIFIYGMHIVFIGSASICFICALLTGWRLIRAKRAAIEQ